MEYETAAQLIELLIMVIMAAAFYYGYSLVTSSPLQAMGLPASTSRSC